MVLKICEYCKKEYKAKRINQRFCRALCQRKHYNRRSEIKEKYRIRIKEYRRTHPEWKEKHRILAITRYRKQRAKYQKKYGKRPEVRKRIRGREKLRLKTDKQYAIANRLRRSLHHALRKYSKTGKVMSSRKYGIDWEEVIDSLKPFPKNLNNFEIDHIIPIHYFDLNDSTQIKKAFDPKNLQWLTREENRRKGGKIYKV